MPYYEIHAIEKDTNTVVTTVINSSITPSQLKKEVEKGGLKVIKINALDSKQIEIYERMRMLSKKRNIIGMSMSLNSAEYKYQKGKILWTRVAAVVIAIAGLAIYLSLFL